MADLANPKWIYAKGVLFLLAGAAAFDAVAMVATQGATR